MSNVRIYTTTYCGFCTRAKQLLERKGAAYQEIDVTGDDEARRKLVEDSGGQRTVPQIWIGERHIGGYSDLAALEREGQLDGVLSGEAASPT
jgi:glutaredoxin 3